MTEELLIDELSEGLYKTSLDALRADVPEVDQDYELIAKMSQSLIETYSIDPEFFKDKSKSLLFAALAQRLGYVRYNQNLPGQQHMQEELFINNALILLLQEHSALFENNKANIDHESVLPDQVLSDIYDKYTNHQLTDELAKAITNGLLDEVKVRLGVTQDTEADYELKVLSIGSDSTAHGMMPPMTAEMEADYNDPGWNDQKLFTDYINGLKKRAEQFSQETGREGELQTAWFIKLGDRQLLCLPQSFAEKLLHIDQPRAKYYTDQDRQRELSVLEHEYAHTQNSLPLDGGTFYGITLEERRAEYFSGDKLGYLDAKGFFSDLKTLTGFDIEDFLEAQKSQDTERSYIDIATQLGLQTMLELMLVTPQAYISDSRPAQKQINMYLGGFDGISRRVYRNVTDQGRAGEVQTRINKVSKELASDQERFDNWVNIRKGLLGLEFVTDLYIKSAESHSALQSS